MGSKIILAKRNSISCFSEVFARMLLLSVIVQNKLMAAFYASDDGLS